MSRVRQLRPLRFKPRPPVRVVRETAGGGLYIQHEGLACALDEQLTKPEVRLGSERPRPGDRVAFVDQGIDRGGVLVRTLCRGQEVYWTSTQVAGTPTPR